VILMLYSEYQARREISDAKGESNDCAVIALSLTCRLPYHTVHAALAQQGRKNNDGTRFEQTQAAVTALGFRLTELIDPVQPSGSRYTPKTVGRLLQEGSYLCRVKGHIFAVIDGRVLDWTDGKRHRINRIYKVEKANQPIDIK